MMRMDVLVTPSEFTIFFLGAVVSAVVAWLLLRSFRRSRERILFWSFLCFALLALESSETLVDYILPPDIDLRLPRVLTALAALGALLYGFLWETE